MEALSSLTSSSILKEVPRQKDQTSLLNFLEPGKRGYLCCKVKKSFSLHCQAGGAAGGSGGAGGGKAIKSSGSFSVITERSSSSSSLINGAEQSAGLMEKTSLILSPNGNSAVEMEATPEEGIGITRFLGGKTFLLTGATGFLGKVLVEKILRTAPDVCKIFILVKAKSKEAAMERLQNEIIDAELFNCLKQTYGKSYQSFMLSKLVPVVGNVCEPSLGLNHETTDMIAKEVDVIVNSAANTTFDERYDVALDINTGGPSRLIHFAKQCKKIKLFLHVSTAYVNGRRQGTVMEKPFSIGDSIARESLLYGADHIFLPNLNVEDEIKLVNESKQVFQGDALLQEMKTLGLERANKFGWQDTYVFTKAMGEMMIDSLRDDIPVVIIRPSVIESTYREPFPG